MDLAVGKICLESMSIEGSGCREDLKKASIDAPHLEDPDNVSIDGPGCREHLDKVSMDGLG